jgi:hypothetical protein
MGSEIDIDMVRGYYCRMSDQEIMVVLTTDAKGLTPEALQVVKEEIQRRKLKPEIVEILDTQQQTGEEAFKVYDPEGCPVEEAERLWLEHSFLYLLEIFGRTFTKNKKVLVPHSNDFPVEYDGSEQSAYETLKIVAQQMEVHFNSIKLDFYDETLQYITEGNPLGLYWGKQENDIFEISLARTALNDPEEMVGTLAHELAHVKLLGENRMEENDEKITDLATMFFGLGIFNANAALKTFNHGWSTAGYLTQMEWGYAFALFANFRKETSAPWLDYLCTNVKADYRQSQLFIASNGLNIFE